MKYLMLICKGFIIGVAKIIPGVSGAIIAISFGVYERLISIISKPLHIKFNDLKFLFFLFLGAALGIGILCKGVKWCLDTYYLPTMLLFIGLIIGGIPEITQEVKKNKLNFKIIFIFVICFTILYYLINVQGDNGSNVINNFVYFLVGVIESATTIIPGISGTAIFMALGWYEILLNIFEGISNFSIDISVLVLFLGGFITSTIMISKMIAYLFKHYKVLAYTGVLGFMIASLVIMLKDTFSTNFSLLELLIGIGLFIVGNFITKKINDIFSKL